MSRKMLKLTEIKFTQNVPYTKVIGYLMYIGDFIMLDNCLLLIYLEIFFNPRHDAKKIKDICNEQRLYACVLES